MKIPDDMNKVKDMNKFYDFKKASTPLCTQTDLWSLQTCERERRQRENEAKMERQRQIEADRNKKALDRALAPPFIKVS